jgi:hypothetical protein
MERQMRPTARAGAMAVSAAVALMLLASTGQTPSGFVPAALGGPLGLFDGPADSMGDVLSIGDGAVDANDLATLLKTTGPSAVPAGPLQVASPPTAANAAELALLPPAIESASAPTSKQSLDLKPVLDGQGKVDCSKAVSCVVDPSTNTTTVTFSDGVVAVVQKINDLTLVAYKTLGDVFEGILPQSLPALPAAVVPAPVISAGPATVPNLAPAPQLSARPDTQAPNTESANTQSSNTKPESSVETGPVAPSAPAAPDLSASDVRPTLTISKPPADFDAPTTGGGSGGGNTGSPGGALDTVKGAVGSVVDAVSDAVKSLGPGAAVSENGPADSPTDTPAK